MQMCTWKSRRAAREWAMARSRPHAEMAEATNTEPAGASIVTSRCGPLASGSAAHTAPAPPSASASPSGFSPSQSPSPSPGSSIWADDDEPAIATALCSSVRNSRCSEAAELVFASDQSSTRDGYWKSARWPRVATDTLVICSRTSSNIQQQNTVLYTVNKAYIQSMSMRTNTVL